MGEIYSSWYDWTDRNILESILNECSPRVVVEAASGPNVAVPTILHNIHLNSAYVSIDIRKEHLQLQSLPLHSKENQGIMADATYLPLRDGSVDLFIFHHALDDILETKGFNGMWASITEALRTLRHNGQMIFSHCVFSNDRYTKEISLENVARFLKKIMIGSFQSIKGRRQEWLFVNEITPVQ